MNSFSYSEIGLSWLSDSDSKCSLAHCFCQLTVTVTAEVVTIFTLFDAITSEILRHSFQHLHHPEWIQKNDQQ